MAFAAYRLLRSKKASVRKWKDELIGVFTFVLSGQQLPNADKGNSVIGCKVVVSTLGCRNCQSLAIRGPSLNEFSRVKLAPVPPTLIL